VTAHDVVIRGAGVLAVAGVLIGGGTYVVGGGGGGPETITANLFLVPPSSSDGSTSCVRSSTELEYDDAVAANAVCDGNGTTSTSWDVACKAATAGDSVGVMPGTYDYVTGGNYLRGGPQSTGVNASDYDCSGGSGVDYDPNWREKGDAEASLANWVHFKPGVDCEGDPNIDFALSTDSGRPSFASANWHIIIGSIPGDTTTPGGECFNFNRTIFLHDRNSSLSASNVRPSNIMFRGKSPSERMQMYGMELRGPKNVLFENIDYGPNVICAANDANATPAYWRCDPNGAYFESVYATNGTNDPGCTPATAAGSCAGTNSGGGADEFAEPFFHGGTCCGIYTNLRLQTFQLHDGNARGNGAEVHPGCFMFDGVAGTGGLSAHNLVMDGVSCERQVIGVQSQDAGVTVQNSYFGCAVVDLPNTSPQGEWDECASAQPSVRLYSRGDLGGGPISNTLYRYNVFFGTNSASALLVTTPDAVFGTYSNVRIVANMFVGAGGLSGCSISGVTCANNAFFTASTAGTSAQTLSCDPTVDSDQSTSDHLWRETTQLDPRLSGASCGLSALNPSSLGTDYQLGFDIDGTARGASSTMPGVDNG
jgi:hypothetical protein